MKMYLSASIDAEEIANAASDDGAFLAAILDALRDYLGDDARDAAWLADAAGNLNESGRRVVRLLAAQIEGGK